MSGKGGKRPQRKKAVAIKYNKQVHNAPVVAAKGGGLLAERIMKLAEEHGIPVREDPDLVETLSHLDIEQEIPPELYHVMAEVLAWVYKINGAYGKPVL
jgi:flagellar biosynthesis protein